MSSFNVKAFLAVLVVLLPLAANGDWDMNIPPVNSPFLENICNEVNCGRGSCEVSLGDPFGFKCNCEPGWKHTRFDDEDDREDDLEFLPCVIPNCTLDYSCMPAAPPTPSFQRNHSIFNPCNWMYCGEGTCTKNITHNYAHSCVCNPGFDNLLNNTAFPCYSECALGSNCQELGIRVSNSTTPGSANDNQATSFLPGKFHFIAIMLTSATIALWK